MKNYFCLFIASILFFQGSVAGYTSSTDVPGEKCLSPGSIFQQKVLTGAVFKARHPSPAQAELLQYRDKLWQDKFRIVGVQDSLGAQVHALFDRLGGYLKGKGRIPQDAPLELTIYDSDKIDAHFVADTYCIVLSTGLLRQLDQYLRVHKQSGLAKDHIAFILGHELQHSIQNYDSSGKSWVEKKGAEQRIEYEADSEGMLLADSIGLNPKAAIDVMDFFQYLDSKIQNFSIQDKIRNRAKDILGSHPPALWRSRRLSNIIHDENTLVLNTEKVFEFSHLPTKRSYYDVLFSLPSQVDEAARAVTQLPGDKREIVALLHVLKHSGFIEHYHTGRSEEHFQATIKIIQRYLEQLKEKFALDKTAFGNRIEQLLQEVSKADTWSKKAEWIKKGKALLSEMLRKEHQLPGAGLKDWLERAIPKIDKLITLPGSVTLSSILSFAMAAKQVDQATLSALREQIPGVLEQTRKMSRVISVVYQVVHLVSRFGLFRKWAKRLAMLRSVAQSVEHLVPLVGEVIAFFEELKNLDMSRLQELSSNVKQWESLLARYNRIKDDVLQDKDILFELIENLKSLGAQMDTLGKGIARIDRLGRLFFRIRGGRGSVPSLSWVEGLVRSLQQPQMAQVISFLEALGSSQSETLALTVQKDTVDALGEHQLRNWLMQDIVGRWPDTTSEQRKVLYEVWYGFLLHDDYQDRISCAWEVMDSECKEQCFSIVSSNPPIFKPDLPDLFDIRMGVRGIYYEKIRQRATEVYSFVQAQYLKEDGPSLSSKLIGTRQGAKALLYGQGILEKLLDHDTYRQALETAFDQAVDLVGLEEIVRTVHEQFAPEVNENLKKAYWAFFYQYLIRKSASLPRISIQAKLAWLDLLFPNPGGAKNLLLKELWKQQEKFIMSQSPQDMVRDLTAILSRFEFEYDHMAPPFFNLSGCEYGMGKREKSFYGTLVRCVLEAHASQAGSAASNGLSLAVLYKLLEQDIVPDYQDVCQFFGDALQRACPEDLLKIASLVKAYGQGKNLDNQEGRFRRMEQRLCQEYHDIFVFAAFLREHRIPICFLWKGKITGRGLRKVRTGTISRNMETYDRFDAIPLYIKVEDDGYERFEVYSIVSSDLHRAWDKVRLQRSRREQQQLLACFRYRYVCEKVLEKHGIGNRLTYDSVISLCQGAAHRSQAKEWMTLLYEFGTFSDAEAQALIPYLGFKTHHKEGVHIAGDSQDNPAFLARCVRADQEVALESLIISDSNAFDMTRRSLQIGFQARNNKHLVIRDLDTLACEIGECQRLFPHDAYMREHEFEKIIIAFVSGVCGNHFYRTDSIDFSYFDGSVRKMAHYEGYLIKESLLEYMPEAHQVRLLVAGFERMYPLFSERQRDYFAKLIYRIIKNNAQLRRCDKIT